MADGYFDLSPLTAMIPWSNFFKELRFKNRFTLSKESQKFIDEVLNYASEYKIITFESNRPFYRSRINSYKGGIGVDGPHKITDMGAPPIDKASSGRLNPTGIPYLYLASDEITAISEVRPWVRCDITLAKFKLQRSVKLINFSKTHFFTQPEGEKFRTPNFIWDELMTHLFSTPFDPRSDTLYIPTQYIAERIKGLGFDGIMYDSSLNPGGYNLTLFDTNAAIPLERRIAKVTSIKIKADITAIE